MITEDYVSFETAKLLKEKGFDELTYACFSSDGKETYYGYCARKHDIMRPSLALAMTWLRDVHHLFISVAWYSTGCETSIYNTETRTWEFRMLGNNLGYSYEQACEEAIKYCLENLI